MGLDRGTMNKENKADVRSLREEMDRTGPFLSGSWLGLLT